MIKNIVVLIFWPVFSFGQQVTKADTDFYRKLIRKALDEKINKQYSVHKAVPDKATAITLAESILFKAYGKDEILSEKPYNVHLIDGYWILSGSLPPPTDDEIVVGGTFNMIISAKNGKVIKLTHYK